MEFRISEKKVDVYNIKEYIEGVEEGRKEKFYKKEIELRGNGRYNSEEFQKEKKNYYKEKSLEPIKEIVKKIEELEIISKEKLEIKEIIKELKKTENKAALRIATKELDKLYKKEEKIKRVVESQIETNLKAYPSKTAIFYDSNSFIIKNSDEPLSILDENLKKLCREVLNNVQTIYLERLNKMKTQNIEKEDKYSEFFILHSKELEQLKIIKEFLTLKVPDEVKRNIIKEEPRKWFKYSRKIAEKKKDLQILESLYSNLEKNMKKEENIKNAIKKLEENSSILPEKYRKRIVEKLIKQEEKEERKKEKILKDISIKKEKKTIAQSFSSIIRYQKMLQLKEKLKDNTISEYEAKKVISSNLKEAEKILAKEYEKGEYISEEPYFYEKSGDVYSIRDENGSEITKAGYYTNQQKINKAKSSVERTIVRGEKFLKDIQQKEEEKLIAEVTFAKMWKEEIDFETINSENSVAFPVEKLAQKRRTNLIQSLKVSETENKTKSENETINIENKDKKNERKGREGREEEYK